MFHNSTNYQTFDEDDEINLFTMQCCNIISNKNCRHSSGVSQFSRQLNFLPIQIPDKKNPTTSKSRQFSPFQFKFPPIQIPTKKILPKTSPDGKMH